MAEMFIYRVRKGRTFKCKDGTVKNPGEIVYRDDPAIPGQECNIVGDSINVPKMSDYREPEPTKRRRKIRRGK